MARVLVWAFWACASYSCQPDSGEPPSMIRWMKSTQHTITSDGMRDLMNDFRGAFDGETVPFFHGRAVDGLLVMLL